jgi:alpha-D-xyloside xylohydrolase
MNGADGSASRGDVCFLAQNYGRFLVRVLIAALLFLPALLPAAADDYLKLPDGVVLQTDAGTLKLQVVADNIVRVAFAKSAILFSRRATAVEPHAVAPKWSLAETKAQLTLSAGKVKARVERQTGRVTFLDAAGQPILAEADGGHAIDPAEVQGEQTYHARQSWQANGDESLYGLGQQQLGIVDIKGYDLDLWQHNTRVVIPMLVSSRGYGIFWDNMSYTRFGDLRQFVPIPAENLSNAAGQKGGLTMTPAGGAPMALAPSPDIRKGADTPKDTNWEGSVTAPVSGDYQIKTYSNGEIKVWLDDKPIIHHYRQYWLTEDEQVKLHLDAGHTYRLKVEWSVQGGDTVQLLWKTPSPETDKTSLWSEVADCVDYYFIQGPKLDNVIAGFRQLTGQAPMMPQWSFGLWQSRQRYKTAQESLDVVKEYRSRKIPFDNIVQDWQYWKENDWGSHLFDPDRFPDPAGWLKSLHDLHSHAMISVWAKFYTNTDNYAELNKAGYLFKPDNPAEVVPDRIYYDAFNPNAREMFWSQMNSRIFQKGMDAWWMDASEPELGASPPSRESMRSQMPKTAMGTGSRVFNGFPLLNSEAVYDGQRSVAPNQRVFILTRSGYAGMQRYAAATWSGDITSTWTAMAKQIPAGLGFSISGMPYWTEDIGGYTMQTKFSEATPEGEEEWRELNARWFEFGTFTPFLRVHGEVKVREPWAMGGDNHPAYKAEVKFDRLRYRLMPYIYSLAGQVTQQAGTIMRPLVMDFTADKTARELNDEYMYGPAFLVAPVTTYQARTRSVYLPKGAAWYDFWTGKTVAAGARLDAAAPFDAIPVYVRGGSIVPFGPEIQYVGEKPADPLTVYVYAGANGSFTLYEDQGANYDYEKGAFSQIPLQWDDASGTLTLGKRVGSFPEMVKERTVDVVLVSPTVPTGFRFDATPAKSVKYVGDAVAVKLK